MVLPFFSSTSLQKPEPLEVQPKMISCQIAIAVASINSLTLSLTQMLRSYLIYVIF